MKLYHISFRDNLSGIWKPQLPAGSELNSGGKYTEPDIPRICLSPTIDQCFIAIYPNISKFYEEKGIKHLTFYVYQPEGKVNAVNTKGVWDSHITDEKWLLEPTKMILVGEVEISVDHNKEIWTNPFNDRKRESKFVSLKPKCKFKPYIRTYLNHI